MRSFCLTHTLHVGVWGVPVVALPVVLALPHAVLLPLPLGLGGLTTVPQLLLHLGLVLSLDPLLLLII